MSTAVDAADAVEVGAEVSPSADATTAPWAGEFDRPPAYEWRVRLPGPRMNAATHAEWSDPVLSGDLVLVGSAAARGLYALSRKDGSVIREFPAENSVESSAVAVGDRVWFGDTGGNTYCYDLTDGDLVWQHDGNAPILVAPVVVPDGSKVLVTNVDDLAVALDAVTGELLWQYRSKRDLTRQTELTLYAAPRAEVADGLAVLGFSSGAIVAVDLETGEEVWKRGVGEGRYPDIVADPVTVGTDLYTSGYYRSLVAIDLPSHNVRWRVDAGAAHAVAVDEGADGQVILYHPGSDGTLRAVVALTGAELWAWDSGSDGALTTPLITAAGLLVASSESSIWLVDPATGQTAWRWHEPWMLRGISADPAIDGRQAIFVTNAGFLYSLIVPRPSVVPEPAWP